MRYDRPSVRDGKSFTGDPPFECDDNIELLADRETGRRLVSMTDGEGGSVDEP